MAAAVASPPATEVDQLTRIRLELATLDQIRSARLQIHGILLDCILFNRLANLPCSSWNFLFAVSHSCYVRDLRFRSVVLQRRFCCVMYGAVVCLHWNGSIFLRQGTFSGFDRRVLSGDMPAVAFVQSTVNLRRFALRSYGLLAVVSPDNC